MSLPTLRNALALLRLLRLLATHRGRISCGLFFLGRGSAITLGRDGRISVGRTVRIMDDFTADVHGRLTIGDDVFFNRGVHIAALQDVEIGRGCLLGEQVSIHDEDHVFGADVAHLPLAERGFRTRPVRIADNVWIGAKATVLGGVVIGEGAVVAAHAVVTRDVPPRTLVAGVPARIVRSWTLAAEQLGGL